MSEKHEILPGALYDADEVGQLLGFGGGRKGRMNRVYEISHEELIRTPVGPRGGKVMYLGSNILKYIHDRTESAA